MSDCNPILAIRRVANTYRFMKRYGFTREGLMLMDLLIICGNKV